MADSGTSIKIAGFNLSGWALAAVVPLLSTISGAIYFGYDAISRFNDVEESVQPLLELDSRIQTLEQAIADNDVRGLSSSLTQIQTQMTTILEQQGTLLDMRSRIDRSTTITDNLNTEVNDLWKAFDELSTNPLR
ncbi:MAG: hypothetical protein ACPHIB_06905 [Thalassobaculaceae bacterium]